MLVKTCLAGKDLCRYKWIIRFRRRRNQQCAEGFPRDYQPLRSSYQYGVSGFFRLVAMDNYE